MSLKSKPKLIPMEPDATTLPQENLEWAISADVLPDAAPAQATTETPPSAAVEPASAPAVEETVPPATSANKPIVEAKSNVSLRLTPSVQMRLKKLAFQMMERSGGERVTLQDLLEKAVMDMLRREEAKFK